MRSYETWTLLNLCLKKLSYDKAMSAVKGAENIFHYLVRSELPTIQN